MIEASPYSICIGFDFPGTFLDSTTLLYYEGRTLEVLRGNEWESHAVRCRLTTESESNGAFDHWQDIVWANQILSELVEMAMIEKLGIPPARKSR
jgi:hypothetical protein